MTLYETDMSETEDSVATSPGLWRPLSQAVGGFDLDPASGAEASPIADTRYTESDDGLAQEWFGQVWLNPPYSEKIAWYRKAVNSVSQGNAERVIALAPVDTSTEWFQRWYSRASVICWLEGRDWYVSEGSPSFNTSVAVFGPTNPDLERTLGQKGVLTEPVTTHTQTEL